MLPVALVLMEGEVMPAGAVPGGDAGCGAKIGFVPVPVKKGGGDPDVEALRALLALGEPPAPWYNAAAQSTLKVERAAQEGPVFVVDLTGELRLAGTCSAPYLLAQVGQTLAKGHPSVEIRLNGSASAWRCISDMSGNCK